MAADEGAFAWLPDATIMAASNLTALLRAQGIADLGALNARAEADPAWYWDTVIRHHGLRFFTPYARILDESRGAPWAAWCVGGTSNLVLNCVDRHRGSRDRHPAILWTGEDGARRTWSYAELDAEVARVAAGLRALGIQPGDVVGLYMPMVPEAIAAFFAVAKVGAIVAPLFSGFSAPPIVARLNDAEAKAVITADATLRRGRVVEMKPVLDAALQEVPTVRHVLVHRRLGRAVAMAKGRDYWWQELPARAAGDVPTEPCAADAPFMLVYTSGTTGRAKGTIHTHMGFTAKVANDYGLCLDVKASDRLMWVSDMGWLMGPLTTVGAALFGATHVIAEGTPDYPEVGRLFKLVQDCAITFLGVAPTVARGFMRHGDQAVAGYDLSSLRITASTGEPWTADAWTWFFQRVCAGCVPILNYAGGTEVGGGIIAGTVLHPMKPCGFAGSIPGMAAGVVRADGTPAAPGEVGELVMRRPSIGLTRGLWRDPERYLDTYWRRFPGLWHHGDWASVDADGVWYIWGRSDDTINIAGKRTGPAEVEAVLLQTGLVAEAAAVGVPDAIKGAALLCACVPMPGVAGDAALVARLSQAVAEGLGAAFRPREVMLVPDLPKTRSMKIMRRVVRAAYLGEDPGDLASLVNPEAVAALKAAAPR